MTSAVSCTDYKEEFSGIRVKNRVTSRADIRTCMQGRVYYGLSCLASVSREALSSKTGANDWATCGRYHHIYFNHGRLHTPYFEEKVFFLPPCSQLMGYSLVFYSLHKLDYPTHLYNSCYSQFQT